jgi:hypothetical protein
MRTVAISNRAVLCCSNVAGTPLTDLDELKDGDPMAMAVEVVVKQEANGVSSAQRDGIVKEGDTELERRKSGDIVEMDEKTLRVYRSRRATIKDLNDLFERGYRLQVKGSTATKATPNVKNFSDVMIKVKRLYADPMSVQSEDIVQSFEALYGVDYSWHEIHDKQLARGHRWAECVERASEDVPATSRESGGQEYHVSGMCESGDGGIVVSVVRVPNVVSMSRYQDRLPQSSKLLLRIRNPNKVFEDHLSIRNSLAGKGVGVYAERIFYKGAVVSLYLGQLVWSSETVGGNIPERTHVLEHMCWDGGPFEAISADHLVPIRDFNGRYYVVCTSSEISKNKGTHVDQNKFTRLYFGAHFMECENDGDANAELLEDGSVVALRQIDQNTAIVLRKEKLRTEEEAKAEVAKAADADEVSEDEREAEPIRIVPRTTMAKVKIESRKCCLECPFQVVIRVVCISSIYSLCLLFVKCDERAGQCPGNGSIRKWCGTATRCGRKSVPCAPHQGECHCTGSFFAGLCASSCRLVLLHASHFTGLVVENN